MPDLCSQPLSTDGSRVFPSGEAEKLFRSNQRLLQKHFGDRVAALKSIDFRKSDYTTIPAADGTPALVGFDKRGQVKVLDELGQPVLAQREWFEKQAGQWGSQSIFLGFGVGHLAAPLEAKLDEIDSMVVIEPVAEILALACATYDLTNLVESGKISFWVPDDSYEGADWVVDWLKETGATEETVIAMILRPSFVISSPEFLWSFASRLEYLDQRFHGMPASLSTRFPEPPDYDEGWSACLQRPGIAVLEGAGKGSPAVVLGDGALSEEEREVVEAIADQGHVITTSAKRFNESPDRANTVVFAHGDFPPSVIPREATLIASAVAACANPFPGDTLVYWGEEGPTVRYTLPSHCTPPLLAEKGTLAVQSTPTGTLLDLAVGLGCSPILVAGFEGLENPARQNPNLPWIGLREQARRADREFLSVSETTATWIEGAKRVKASQVVSRFSSLPALNLKRKSASNPKGFKTLPKSKCSIDRSLSVGGIDLLDKEGRMLVEPETKHLETIFKYNLTALHKRLSPIAQLVEERMRAQQGDEFYQMGKGTEGFPLLAIQSLEGNPLATLPGSPNPWPLIAETEFWKKGYTDCGNLFLGIGLGFYLEVFLERTEVNVVLWEPVIDRLMAAMHLRNLKPLFAHNRLTWLVGRTAREAVGHFMNNRMTEVFRAPPNWRPMVEPGMRPALASHMREFRGELANRAGEIRSARMTLKTVVKTRATSYLRNSPRTAGAIPMDRLTGQFKGTPAIVVAAGPSLDENVQLLNEVEDRALIFVVDTSFRVVQPREIDRHFVASIDPKQESKSHFEDRQPREEDILIATTGTPEEIWDLFPNPKVFGDFLNEQDPSPLIDWLSKVLDYEISRFWGGGSVAISALGAARQMGCDPIVLIGQDLAILPDRTHASDTIYPERSKQGRRVQEKEVPAIGGGTTQTTRSLLAIKTNLEHQIRWNRLNVINATAFGARIEGTREMPFEQVLCSLPNERIKVRARVQEIGSGISPKKVGRLEQALRGWRKEIGVVESESRKLCARIEGLKKKIGRGDYPKNCNEVCAEIPRDLLRAGFNSPALRRMEDFFYTEAVRYIEYENRVQGAPDSRRKLKWQVDRTLPLLEALQRGVERVREEIDLVLNRIEG